MTTHAALVAVVAVALASCSAASTAAPAPQPGPYIVVVSEPSQNIQKNETSYLTAYWSCAPDADPRARFDLLVDGITEAEWRADHPNWTEVVGEKRRDSLRVDVPCKPGDTITVALDAAAVAYRPTRVGSTGLPVAGAEKPTLSPPTLTRAVC